MIIFATSSNNTGWCYQNLEEVLVRAAIIACGPVPGRPSGVGDSRDDDKVNSSR